MAARQEEGRYETQVFACVLVCKGISNGDVGVAKGTVFEDMRPGVGFKPAISFKKSWGGYRRTTHFFCFPRIEHEESLYTEQTHTAHHETKTKQHTDQQHPNRQSNNGATSRWNSGYEIPPIPELALFSMQLFVGARRCSWPLSCCSAPSS